MVTYVGERTALLPSAADHFIGNIDADNRASGPGSTRHQPACPAFAAAEFQDSVVRAEFHSIPHGFRDGRMVHLHPFATPLPGPPVEAPPEERVGTVGRESPAKFDGLGEGAERSAKMEGP